MRLCIFSDVHGNLPALETLLAATRDRVDGYVCLGDIVNYGPWNDECLEQVFALPNVYVIQGNHERLFLESKSNSAAAELPLVQKFLATSYQWFSRDDLVRDMPNEIAMGNYVLVHTLNNARIYPDTRICLRGNFFIGHTHHQFRIDRPEGVIVNCGSIGQNRQNGGSIAFAIWDCGSNAIALHQAAYPVQRFLRELRVRKYPYRCIQYYHELIARANH